MRYAVAPQAPLSLLLAGAPAEQKADVMLDAGYVNPELGKQFGVGDWTEYADHTGGTSRFPKAKFIVQRRELEYAAGALPHNSAAKSAFVAEDVLAVVRLNWQGRVLLVDGDVEGVVPGVDAYLTPGHTAGRSGAS